MDIAGKSLFECVKDLVLKQTGLSETDQAFEDIMAKRAVADERCLTDLVSEEALEEVFDKDEQKQISAADGKVKENRLRLDSYRCSMASWVEKQRAAARPQQQQPPHTRPRRGSAVASSSSAPAPPTLLQGEVDRHQAQTMMPGGYRVFKDMVNRRWQCYTMAKMHIASRSWAVYGDRPAMLAVIWEAWGFSEMRGGEPCPFKVQMRAELVAANMLQG